MVVVELMCVAGVGFVALLAALLELIRGGSSRQALPDETDFRSETPGELPSEDEQGPDGKKLAA
jgi:hypothetical protein